MNTLDIHAPEKTWHFEIPSQWSELTREDFEFLGTIYPFEPTWDMQVHVLAQFIRLRSQSLGFKWRMFRDMPEDELYITLEQLDFFRWIYDLQQNTHPTNLFPTVKVGAQTLHGWTDNLDNLTIEEYSFADTLYINLFKSGDIGNLDKLLATLYRPAIMTEDDPEYRGDVRELYNPYQHTKKPEAFATLNNEYKYALMLNFLGARGWIVEKYHYVFKKAPNKRQAQGEGWGPVLLRLYGEAPDQDRIDRMNRTNFRTTLAGLEQAKKDAEERERRLKAGKR